MVRPTKLSEKDKGLIRKLRDEGMTYDAIAIRFEVSSQTIRRICDPAYCERQKESNRKYQAEKGRRIRAQRAEISKRYQVVFHTVHDAAVVKQLSKQDNIQDYIRQLVLQDISSDSRKEPE